MPRPSLDEVAMATAKIWSRRSTCLRRAVGCVLTNERGHVIATGYNGVAAGLPHCNDVENKWVDKWVDGNLVLGQKEKKATHPHACDGATAPSGTNLDGCQAIHAEQNALLQCRDIYSIHTCYVTASPCVTCTKLLLNTSCLRIVFLEEYPHPAARQLWERTGRVWQQLTV